MFRRILPLSTGLILALGLSQFPEFAQQYTQRVGGAYEEIHRVAEDFRTDATLHGKTLTQAVAEYQQAENAFFQDRGKSMQKVLTREAYLRQHYDALIAGDGFNQLMVFTLSRDTKIAGDTLGIYKPALPLTFTGLAHAALGFLLGYGMMRLPFRRRRRQGVMA